MAAESSDATDSEEVGDEDENADEDDDDAGRRARRRKMAKSRQSTPQRGTSAKPSPSKRSKNTTPSTPKSPRRRRRPTLHIPDSGTKAIAPQTKQGAARAQLHLAALPASPEALPCREVEFYSICEFVREKILASASGCMFVSGVPGTGEIGRGGGRLPLLKRALGWPHLTLISSPCPGQRQNSHHTCCVT